MNLFATAQTVGGMIEIMGFNIMETLSVALATYAFLKLVYWLNGRRSSPFASDNRKKRKPYITDQRKQAEVLKQHFSIEEVIFWALELDEVQARNQVFQILQAAVRQC